MNSLEITVEKWTNDSWCLTKNRHGRVLKTLETTIALSDRIERGSTELYWVFAVDEDGMASAYVLVDLSENPTDRKERVLAAEIDIESEDETLLERMKAKVDALLWKREISAQMEHRRLVADILANR